MAAWVCWDESASVGYVAHDALDYAGRCCVCGEVIDWRAFARAASADPGLLDSPARTGAVVYRDGRWIAREEAA